MIQVAGAVVPVPIDAEGVVLPGDEFAVVEALRYPRVCGIAGAAGPVGARWNDCRVLGAARLIERLGPAWQRLGLERLEVSAASALPRPRETVYTLVTRGGTQLIWGRAPGDEIAGERPAKEKLACLQRYADEGWTGGPARPQAIDLTGL
jgi:hypothetical protein